MDPPFLAVSFVFSSSENLVNNISMSTVNFNNIKTSSIDGTFSSIAKFPYNVFDLFNGIAAQYPIFFNGFLISCKKKGSQDV